MALSNACLTFENIFDNAIGTAFSLSAQPDIKDFLYSAAPDKQTIFSISGFCQSFFTSYSEIHSIYLVNHTGVTQSFGAYCDDKEYVAGLVEMINSNSRLNPIKSQMKNAKGEIVELYTIYYNEYDKYKTGVEPSILVNIEIDEVYKEIYSEYWSENQNVVITDRNGMILLNKDKSLIFSDASGEEFFVKASGMNSEKSSFPLDINDNSYFVNAYAFGNGKYYAFLFTDHDTFFSRITAMRNLIITCSVILIVLLLALSLYFARTLFRPINNAIFSILKTSKDKPLEGKNHWELKSITTSVNSVLQKLNAAEKQSEYNAKKAKENFLKNVFLASVNITNKELSKKFIQYKIFKDMPLSPSYFIAIYRIGHYKEFCQNNNASAIEFQIETVENIIAQKISDFFENSVFHIDNNHIILLGRLKEQLISPKTAVTKKIIALSKNIQASVLDLFGFELTVSISESFLLSAPSLREIYNKTYERTNYRLVYGKDALLTEHDINTNEIKNTKINEQINRILSSFKNLDECKIHLRELFDLVKYCNYDFIIITFFNLSQSIEKKISETTGHPIDLQGMHPDDLYLTIKEFEDYQDFERFFVRLLDKANAVLTEIKNMGMQYHINHMLEYIDENYQDINITAYIMAEKLSISPQYFSKIFKDITGCSFPTYVNNVRMEKAKELLLAKKRISISEICDKVGYNNIPYFTNLFKKKYSVSPSKYRQIAKNDFV